MQPLYPVSCALARQDFRISIADQVSSVRHVHHQDPTKYGSGDSLLLSHDMDVAQHCSKRERGYDRGGQHGPQHSRLHAGVRQPVEVPERAVVRGGAADRVVGPGLRYDISPRDSHTDTHDMFKFKRLIPAYICFCNVRSGQLITVC